MFNVTVLRLKDIVKYIICIFVLILLIFSITNYFSGVKKNTEQVTQKVENVTNQLSSHSLLSCLDATLPVVASINHSEEKEKEKLSENDILKSMLETQISSIDEIQNMEVSENTEAENAEEEQNISLAETGATTEVITSNPIAENYNAQYGSVKIRNQTDYELTQEMLTPDIELEDKKDIIIYHTHTCESYTQSTGFEYTPSGNFRTTDLNFSVVRVGRELKNRLTNYGFNVIHDETYHDYPAYSGSYNRSLTSIKNDLAANPNAQIVIDLHRDAVGEGGTYAPTVKIGDDYVAQIMFVIGTDGGGLTHSQWVQNLKYAIKIVEKGNELYPGLFKPIMVRNSRYNQHVAKAATIMEIGATGNTMDQCLNSMKYLSKVIDEALNK